MSLSLETLELKAGRPLYISIADHIEKLIESRTLKHNDKLPNTAELAKRFDVTISTVQQGLGRLVEKGLLKRSPKLGTFVNTSKESRCVAVAFGFDPFDLESRFYSLYYHSLEKALEARGMAGIRHFGLMGEGFAPALRRLKSDLEEGRCSCVLAISHSQEFMAWARVQRLAACFTQVLPDLRKSAYDGMRHLLDRGYRRIAFVSMCNGYDTWVLGEERKALAKAYGEKGLPFANDSILNWGTSADEAYRKTVEFFSKTPKREWPDAIFCHHDVLTKGVLIALSELGIEIPGDIALATHANKGDGFMFHVPLTRIECDPEKMAVETVAFIERSLNMAPKGLIEADFRSQPVLVEGRSTPPQKKGTTQIRSRMK